MLTYKCDACGTIKERVSEIHALQVPDYKLKEKKVQLNEDGTPSSYAEKQTLDFCYPCYDKVVESALTKIKEIKNECFTHIQDSTIYECKGDNRKGETDKQVL